MNMAALLKRIQKDAWFGAGWYSLNRENNFTKYYFVGGTKEQALTNAVSMRLPEPVFVSEEQIAEAEKSMKDFIKNFRRKE
jgi:hypothetical protein